MMNNKKRLSIIQLILVPAAIVGLWSPVSAQRKYPTGGTPKPSPPPSKKATKPSVSAPAVSPLEHWKALVEKGRGARANGNHEEAERDFLEAVRVAEGINSSAQPMIEACVLLAETYVGREKFTEAEPFYRRALEKQQSTLGPRHPETVAVTGKLAELYALRAAAKTKAGNLDEALSDYTRAIELTPEAALYGNRADLKAVKKDFDGALADFERAVELGPTDAAFHNAKRAGVAAARATTKNNLGDYDGALADLKQAAEFSPTDAPAYKSLTAEVYVNRATVEINNGDYERAAATLNLALQTDPTNQSARKKSAALHENRGVVNNNNGDFQAAVEDFQKAAELDPDNKAKYVAGLVAVYLNRGTVRANNGDFDSAIADYRQAVELDPSKSSANRSRLADLYFQRAVFKFNQGDFEATVTDCTRAVEINPKLAVAYARRAFACKQLNRLKEAAEDSKKAKELDSSLKTPF